MSELLQHKIKSRGYWMIRIIPAQFQPTRIATLPLLKQQIRELAVDSGTVAFPAGAQTQLTIGKDWVSQDLDSGGYAQAWRFYQSGQLILYEAFLDDWLDESMFGVEPGWASGKELSVSDVLMTYWQVYEFATRLATKLPGADPISVSIHALGLRDRALLYRFRNRSRLRARYVATINDYETTADYERADLISRPLEHVVGSARQLLERFGWDPDPQLLHSLLRESGLAAQ